MLAWKEKHTLQNLSFSHLPSQSLNGDSLIQVTGTLNTLCLLSFSLSSLQGPQGPPYFAFNHYLNINSTQISFSNSGSC